MDLTRVMIFAAITGGYALGCVSEPSSRAPVDAPRLDLATFDPPDGSLVAEAHPRWTIELSTWLDVRRSAIDRAFRFESGPLTVPGQARYDPLGPLIVVEPAGALRPGLTWTLEVRDGLLISVWGESATEVEAPVYPIRAADDQDADPTPAEPRWGAIESILIPRCPCHFDPASTLPGFDRQTLLEEPVRAYSRRRYVVPHHPAESYLVEKLIPGYPDRYLTEMPPPWADLPPLTDAELRDIVDWIVAGAPD